MRKLEIACHQIMMEDSSVFSSQWTTIPLQFSAGVDPKYLFERYRVYLQRFTLGLVRPVSGPDGVEFRLLGSRLSLLSFSPPERTDQGDRKVLAVRICGGELVQRDQCHRGELLFVCQTTPGGVRVMLQLVDYCPLILGARPSWLRSALYRLTQAAIHQLVTVRFLACIYRERAGADVCIRLVQDRTHR